VWMLQNFKPSTKNPLRKHLHHLPAYVALEGGSFKQRIIYIISVYNKLSYKNFIQSEKMEKVTSVLLEKESGSPYINWRRNRVFLHK